METLEVPSGIRSQEPANTADHNVPEKESSHSDSSAQDQGEITQPNSPESKENTTSFEKFYEEIEEKFDMEDQGIGKEIIEGAYNFYSQNYADRSTNEWIEAIRMDLEFGQIDHYLAAVKKAEELGEGKGAEFEEAMRELSTLEVIQAMGGKEDATEKLNEVFEDTEFEEVVIDFGNLYEAMFDYAEYRESEMADEESEKPLLEEEVDNLSPEEAVTRLEEVLKKLESLFAQLLFDFKGINIEAYRKDLIDSIDELMEGVDVKALPLTIKAAIRNL